VTVFPLVIGVEVKVKVSQLCPTLCDPMDYTAYQNTGVGSLELEPTNLVLGFPGGSVNPPANAGDTGSIPGSGKSLEKEMATHCSILAWKIPWTEKPGGLQSMGPQRVRHD